MSIYTQPPWKAVYFQNSDQWDVSNDAGDPSCEFSVLEDMIEPHARLIAAAPDLLEACRAMYNHLAPLSTNQPRGLLLAARQAIAKAGSAT